MTQKAKNFRNGTAQHKQIDVGPRSAAALVRVVATSGAMREPSATRSQFRKTMTRLYADYNATAPLRPQAREAMLAALFLGLAACDEPSTALIDRALTSSEETLEANLSSGKAIDKYIYSIALEYQFGGSRPNRQEAERLRLEALSQQKPRVNHASGAMENGGVPEISPALDDAIQNCLGALMREDDSDGRKYCGGQSNYEKYATYFQRYGATNSQTHAAALYDGYHNPRGVPDAVLTSPADLQKLKEELDVARKIDLFLQQAAINRDANTLIETAEREFRVSYRFSLTRPAGNRGANDFMPDSAGKIHEYQGGTIPGSIYATHYDVHTYDNGLSNIDWYVSYDDSLRSNMACIGYYGLAMKLQEAGFQTTRNLNGGGFETTVLSKGDRHVHMDISPRQLPTVFDQLPFVRKRPPQGPCLRAVAVRLKR
jgi:hypothetical protein